jgi:phosphoadenosine phosphosulfate reductase
MNIPDLEAFLSRHEMVALQFSAGKDSRACLKLLTPYLDQIVVLWANSGNPYPETITYMDEIYSMVPHFVEVLGEQPEWTLQYGMPVDVMPVSASAFKSQMHGREVPLLQPFNQCCAHNLWQPMARWMVENQVTGLIRGQKSCDSLAPPYKSGDILGGIEFFHPIEDWSNGQVFDFLGADVPPSYARGLPSSLDCLNCTAYVKENKGRLADLDLIYPPAAKQIRSVHAFLRDELSSHLNDLEA